MRCTIDPLHTPTNKRQLLRPEKLGSSVRDTKASPKECRTWKCSQIERREVRGEGLDHHLFQKALSFCAIVTTCLAVPVLRAQAAQGGVQELAAGFELPNPFSSAGVDNEPSDPFTLQGTTEKKFVIEKLDGTKIVSRSRGFTTRTCVKVASNSQTDPSGKIIAPSESTCRVAEDKGSIKAACQQSCKSACLDGLDSYEKSATSFTGFKPTEDALNQARKKCMRNCAYQCQKEGTGYIFTVNSLN